MERFKAFTVADLQLLYNAVDFYLENRIGVYNGKESIKEPTEDVYAVPVFGDTKEFAVLKAEELGVTQKALLRALVNKFGHHLTADDVEGEVA